LEDDMKIIIVGCGKVGANVAEQLLKEGHDITVIDNDPHVIDNITNNLDLNGVIGDGVSCLVLGDAGVKETDLLIATTDSDERNILCCMFAKKLGGCTTIARVRNPIYSRDIRLIRGELGLAMAVNPEQLAALEISRLLRFPSAIKIETFAKGKVEILEFKVAKGSIIDGMSLMDLGKKISSDVLICAAVRGEHITMPKGNYIIEAGDVLSLVAPQEESKRFFEKIGLETHQVKNVMIVGASTICLYLAELLESLGVEISVIEKDEAKCIKINEVLPNVRVINDDAIDQDTLIDAGVDNCEAFVSLTGIDEANIMLSLFARSRNENAKLVTKINKISFDNIVEDMDLGSIISPKTLTADVIVMYVRGMQNSLGSNVQTLHKIVNKKAEALEFCIKSGCPLVGKAIEDLKLIDNLLVACISSNGNIITPNGQTVIHEGDTVVVVTTKTGLKDIEDILG
jgi:hypothetical protein